MVVVVVMVAVAQAMTTPDIGRGSSGGGPWSVWSGQWTGARRGAAVTEGRSARAGEVVRRICVRVESGQRNESRIIVPVPLRINGRRFISCRHCHCHSQNQNLTNPTPTPTPSHPHIPRRSTPCLPCLASPTLTMQSRQRAVQCLHRATRSFSSTPRHLAVSPYRKPALAAASKILTEDAKRTQSTAAAATQTPERARPAPAFNREDHSRYNVSPLAPYKAPEMDHSFVGMTGGEIFHEIMLRQNVKHICMPMAQLRRSALLSC
jgi:hypothetical protein